MENGCLKIRFRVEPPGEYFVCVYDYGIDRERDRDWPEAVERAQSFYAVEYSPAKPTLQYPLLPFACRTAAAAKLALRRIADTVVPCEWEKFKVEMLKDGCRFVRLPVDDRSPPLELRICRKTSPYGRLPFDENRDCLLVANWTAIMSKARETEHLTGAEWLKKIDPSRHDGDGAARSRKADEYAAKCDWWKIDLRQLDVHQWHLVLRYRPDLANRCSCWDEFTGFDLCRILRRQPTLLDRAQKARGWQEWSENMFLWVALLSRQPKLANRFSRWESLYNIGGGWARLLVHQPSLSGRCDLGRFKSYEWVELLCARPEFAGQCDFGGFSSSDWVQLLSSQPKFADQAPMIFSVYEWEQLLGRQPEFGDRCSKEVWKSFSRKTQLELLKASNVFLRFIEDEWNVLPTAERIGLLLLRPELANKMDWSLITDPIDWFRLIAVHPQLTRFAPPEIAKPEHSDRGIVWLGASGPIAVVPLMTHNWISQYGKHIDCHEFRIERYCRGDVDYTKMWDIAREWFPCWLNRPAVALDGVYVSANDEDETATRKVRNFVEVVQLWLSQNETSLKLLLLECGYVYNGVL